MTSPSPDRTSESCCFVGCVCPWRFAPANAVAVEASTLLATTEPPVPPRASYPPGCYRWSMLVLESEHRVRMVCRDGAQTVGEVCRERWCAALAERASAPTVVREGHKGFAMQGLLFSQDSWSWVSVQIGRNQGIKKPTCVSVPRHHSHHAPVGVCGIRPGT